MDFAGIKYGRTYHICFYFSPHFNKLNNLQRAPFVISCICNMEHTISSLITGAFKHVYLLHKINVCTPFLNSKTEQINSWDALKFFLPYFYCSTNLLLLALI
jgi:hypothetical protein